jgi:hypothetical protein
MEGKCKKREDAAEAHTDFDADGVVRDAEIPGLRYRALERVGRKIFDPVDVICTLWDGGAQKAFGEFQSRWKSLNHVAAILVNERVAVGSL